MSLRLPIPSPVAHTVRHVGCILPVAGQCSLPESVSGFHAALDNEPRAVLGHLVVVPALLELPPDFARGIVSWLRHGATVIVESGAAFTGQLSFRRHRRSLRDGLQLAVHAPVRLWSEQRPSRRTPYVDYTWPHPAKIRDFSRVVPLGDQPGEIIARADGLPVALKRRTGPGTLIYLGSPLGPALWAGDVAAKRWLLSILA